MIIGVDVGGTNTDAVLMDGSTLVGAAKRPTTGDVSSGIRDVLGEALHHLPRDRRVDAVMVGTTHLTNALLERRRLSPTAVLRLALPATESLPPLVDWPAELKHATGAHTFMVRGGHEYDGREISPLDGAAIRRAIGRMRREGVRAVAVSGVFSPVNPRHENEAAAIIRQEAPELRLSLSHENGRVGLLQRENAAVLNACLGDVADLSVRSIRDALASLEIDAPLYISQNDGTLMDAGVCFPPSRADHIFRPHQQHARRCLSLRRPRRHRCRRGRHHHRRRRAREGLSAGSGGGDRDSPECAPTSACPTCCRSPSAAGAWCARSRFASVRTAPAIGCAREAMVFGGGALTATDVAVAAGRARVGDPRRVENLDEALVDGVMTEIRRRAESAIDRVKTSAHDVPVILVGGGNILLGDSLAGASRVLRPPHCDRRQRHRGRHSPGRRPGGARVLTRRYGPGTGGRRLPRRRLRQGRCRRAATPRASKSWRSTRSP